MAQPLSILPLAATLLAMTQMASAKAQTERRCGWFVNVTPGNFELDDRQGQWTIAEQGGYEASGFDSLPDMSSQGWAETNGSHGHGCACMIVSTDRPSMRVTRIVSATPVPLKQCRSDRMLPRP